MTSVAQRPNGLTNLKFYDEARLRRALASRSPRREQQEEEEKKEKWEFVTCESTEEAVVFHCNEATQLIEASLAEQNRTTDFFTLETGTMITDKPLLSWNEIKLESEKRKRIVDTLEQTLQTIEEERTSKIRKQFCGLTDYLSKHTHLSPKEAKAVFLDEILRVNTELMMNEREIAALVRNLRLVHVVEERKTQLMWDKNRIKWQQFNTNRCLEELRSYMQSDAFRRPTSVRNLIEELSHQNKRYDAMQTELLEKLSKSMVPPDFTSEILKKWLEEAFEVYTAWDKMNQTYLESIYKAYETHSQESIDRVKAMQLKLVEQGYQDSMKVAGELLESLCIPILGEMQKLYEENLNYIDRCFTWTAYTNLHGIVTPVYRFGEALVEFWQSFANQTAEAASTSLEKKLSTERQRIAKVLDRKDEVMNLTIDALRQSESDDRVNEKLAEVLKQLNQMKNIYEDTKNQQLVIVDAYTTEALEIVDTCETGCFRFFGVTPIAQKRPTGSARHRCNKEIANDVLQIQLPATESDVSCLNPLEHEAISLTPIEADTKDRVRYFHIKPRSDAIEALTTPFDTNNSSRQRQKSDNVVDPIDFFRNLALRVPVSGILGEELPLDLPEAPVVVGRGNSPVEARATIHADINPEVEPMKPDEFIVHVLHPVAVPVYEEMVHYIKKNARRNFLTLIPIWRIMRHREINQEVVLRRQEVEAEFELQLRLHEPRIRRTREDIANVRLTELALHEARINRHIEAVKMVLADLRATIMREVNRALDTSNGDMQKKIGKAVKERLTQATKSSILRNLRAMVEEITFSHMNQVRDVLKLARENLEDRTRTLSVSNSNLLKSLKLFSDGGNFAIEEARFFSARLADIASQINTVQEDISGKMEAVEKDRQVQVDQRLKTFEQELRHHMNDVLFAENVVRCGTNALAQIKGVLADNESQRKSIEIELERFDQVQRELRGMSESRMNMTQWNEDVLMDNLNQINVSGGGKEWKELRRDNEAERVHRERSLESLKLLVMLCQSAGSRCVFLNCLRIQTKDDADSGTPGQEGPPRVNRIEGPGKTTISKATFSASIHVSRPGRCAAEDACIKVAQSIINEHVRHTESVQSTKSKSDKKSSTTPGDSSELSDSKELVSRQVTLESVDASKQESYKLESDSESSPKRRRQKRESTVKRRSKTALVPKTTSRSKNESYADAFGSPDPPNGGDQLSATDILEQVTMMGHVRRICRENLTAMIRLAEIYYRHKGLRQPTRPKLIPNTLDEACHALVVTLRCYYKQTTGYRNDAVVEFTKQSIQFEEVATRLPSLLFDELVDDAKSTVIYGLEICTKKFAPNIKKLLLMRYDHIKTLRPGLGSPANKTELERLKQAEEGRQLELLELTSEMCRAQRLIVRKAGKRFSQRLVTLADTLFLRFDKLTCGDDIEWATKDEVIYSLTDMLALKQTEEVPSKEEAQIPYNLANPLESIVTRSAVTNRGKSTWFGPELAGLIVEKKTPTLVTIPCEDSKPKQNNQRPNLPDRALGKMKKKRKKFIIESTQVRPNANDESEKKRSSANYCLVSSKTSTAHISAFRARDDASSVFRDFAEGWLRLIDKQLNDMQMNNETWKHEWSDSLKALSSLF